MGKHLNQDGFTLVEILVVIAIIAILFVTLLPQIDNAVNQSRISNVRNDLRGYQVMTHNFLLTTRGQGVDVEQYNGFLDKALQFDLVTNQSGKKDAWGSPYHLEAFGKKTVIVSNGTDEKKGTDDDILLAMYVTRDNVDVCTSGLEPNDLELKAVKLKAGETCGGEIEN